MLNLRDYILATFKPEINFRFLGPIEFRQTIKTDRYKFQEFLDPFEYFKIF
jgi:hypothetical protein